MSDEMPRRCYVQKWTATEKAINDVMKMVDRGPAHPLLTEAVVLLGEAQGKVSDYVDAHGDPAKDGWENEYPNYVDEHGVVRSV